MRSAAGCRMRRRPTILRVWKLYTRRSPPPLAARRPIGRSHRFASPIRSVFVRFRSSAVCHLRRRRVAIGADVKAGESKRVFARRRHLCLSQQTTIGYRALDFRRFVEIGDDTIFELRATVFRGNGVQPWKRALD